MSSVPFYDFPSSPLLIIGALGILVAIAVFFLAYQKYFKSPFNKELQQKKKALLKEKKELNERLQMIIVLDSIRQILFTKIKLTPRKKLEKI